MNNNLKYATCSPNPADFSQTSVRSNLSEKGSSEITKSNPQSFYNNHYQHKDFFGRTFIQNTNTYVRHADIYVCQANEHICQAKEHVRDAKEHVCHPQELVRQPQEHVCHAKELVRDAKELVRDVKEHVRHAKEHVRQVEELVPRYCFCNFLPETYMCQQNDGIYKLKGTIYLMIFGINEHINCTLNDIHVNYTRFIKNRGAIFLNLTLMMN